MLTREIVLRLLRLNLIPAPRVIVPGPATAFPVLYVDRRGGERVIRSLSEARTFSAPLAGAVGGEEAEGFFVETVPVVRTEEVEVSGLSAPLDMAARAAYCVGLDRARVTLGFGPGGPWVMRVTPVSPDNGAQASAPDRRVEFACARAEYIAVDQRTGIPIHEFFTIEFSPEGEPAALACSGNAALKWVSSPMPYPDMPLSTRLVFRGTPTFAFLRALDRSAAVLGVLVSPTGEARERHATEEGLLGACRVFGGGSFEYLSVPSLLWSPAAIRRLCELARDAAAAYNASGAIEGASRADEELWRAGLEVLYRFQRAYYHVDKAFFQSERPWREMVAVAEAFTRRAAPGGGRETDLRRREPAWQRDFRGAWGIRVPSFSNSYVTLATLSGRDLTGEAAIGAGARSECLPPERLLLPDILDPGLTSRSSLAWAHSERLSPNPVLARRLALPGDILYRAEVCGQRESLQGAPFRIGPVVGIMASEETGTRRFGIETDRFRRIITLGAEMGLLVYVFFPDKVDWGARLVKGWIYREKRGWVSDWLPLPDIVYDRHIPEVLPAGGVVDAARAFHERYREALFLNSLPFVSACRDKLEIQNILAKDPFLRRHLPDVLEASDPGEVTLFIASRERSFLKLRRGSGSKGLVFIENLGSRYRISRREKGMPPDVAVVSGKAALESAVSDILDRGRRSSGGYIVQEGIDLARLPGETGSAFEVRVICQKGGAGRWMRTGMVCRVNPTAERFMVPREEVHYRIHDLLASVFPGRVNEVRDSIRRVARLVPSIVERAAERGGEMSVDLGIDKHGKPWLIEVNSKPATLFRDIGAFGLRELTLLRVLNYAVALFRDRKSVRE